MFAKLSSVRRGALVDEPKDEGDIESALTKFSEDIAQEAPPSHPQQACDARVNVISRETTGLSNNSEPSEPSHREVGHRMISFNLENEEEPPAQKNIPRPPSLGIMSFREGSSSRRKSLDPINSTAVFGEALVHRAFSKRIISTNLVSSKVSGSDDKLLSRFGAGSPSGIGSRQGSCRSLDACSISSSSAALATRTKLKQRGPPESLMGVHDCPIPLSRKEDWSDPKYCSNRIVPVRIQTHIIDLKEIDTVRQEFVAVVWVQMKWRESLPEGTNCNKQLSEKELTALGIGKWRPTLTFIGINHDFKSDENVRPSHSPGNSYVTLFMRYNISGTFARRMEVRPSNLTPLHFMSYDDFPLYAAALLPF